MFDKPIRPSNPTTRQLDSGILQEARPLPRIRTPLLVQPRPAHPAAAPCTRQTHTRAHRTPTTGGSCLRHVRSTAVAVLLHRCRTLATQVSYLVRAQSPPTTSFCAPLQPTVLHLIRSLVLGSLVFTTSCASGTAGDLAPAHAPTPIRITSGPTADISFFRLLIDVPFGTRVGHHHRGLLKVRDHPHVWDSGPSTAPDLFRREASALLRQQGYSVLGSDNPLFGDDRGATAQYQLGGTIAHLAFDTYDSLAGNYAEALLDLEWQLFDTRQDSVVFVVRTRGYARRGSHDPGTVMAAFRDGLARLLSDSTFVAHVTATNQSDKASLNSDVAMAECHLAEPVALPIDLERLFRSIVIVRPGMTFGSGVIVSPQGHILTAAHVVAGLLVVPVRLRTGIELDAQVIATQEDQDVALLKIAGDRHECLPIADSRPGIGTDLFAVGSPRSDELAFSVTGGIVSGFRQIDGNEYIQTDASLNPGNSGGPLVTVDGVVIGIVSWKYTDTEGIAFGVPGDVVKRTLRITDTK